MESRSPVLREPHAGPGRWGQAPSPQCPGAALKSGQVAQRALARAGSRDWPPCAHPCAPSLCPLPVPTPVPIPVPTPCATPCPPVPTPRPAHLDAVLLQVQVPRVDGDAGRHLGQIPPRADDPAGLVAAGAGRGARGGGRGAPSGGRGQGHATPAGPQGRGEEPEEEQGPAGPGHPTGRQRGARGAAGARHPHWSCSARAPGGCGGRGRERRGSVRPVCAPRHPAHLPAPIPSPPLPVGKVVPIAQS